MAESASACENKSIHKPATFSELEIEAAQQLIQLSSTDDSDHEDHHSSSNNDSFSSVQGKAQQISKVDAITDGDVSSISSSTAITEDVLAEAEEDENFARRNKRYRYLEDLYNVTAPVIPSVKAKKALKGRKRH